MAVAGTYNVAHEIASMYTTCGTGVVPTCIVLQWAQDLLIAWTEKLLH